MSWVDRVLGSVGLQRKASQRARGMRQFAGARVDRLTQDLFSGTTSGNSELKLDLRRLRNRSRTLFRDSALVKRYCNLFAENVSGEVGIQCRPAALLRDGNADTKLNDAVSAAWQRWAESKDCTVDGRLDWVDLQQQLDRSEPMDGEILLRLVDGHGPFGFAVQVLDPDQLDETLNVEPSNGGPWIRQGVQLDPNGRPVAYHIWDGHPSDARKGQRRPIAAADIIHDFVALRPGAARGVPWLHAGLTNVNMLEGYIEAALVAARVAASAMAAVSGIERGEDEVSDVPLDLEPGKMFELPEGAEATLLDPKHPTTSFSDFVKTNVRLIANAGGVSYTSLSGDLEAVNYSSIRAGLLAERDHYKMLQQRRIRHVHRRIYARWLRMAQLSGALPIAAVDVARAERVAFQPRGFPWVDPTKDIEALRQEIHLGLNSRTAAAAERGRDFEKMLEQLDAEVRLAAKYGVDVSGAEPAPPQHEEPFTPARGLRIANA